MLTTKLKDAVIRELINRPAYLQYKQIEKDTTVPEGWIKRLVRGAIAEPSGPRLETLYEYLTKKSLNF